MRRLWHTISVTETHITNFVRRGGQVVAFLRDGGLNFTLAGPMLNAARRLQLHLAGEPAFNRLLFQGTPRCLTTAPSAC